MERVKKWCQAHQKACLITGIIGMLLSPFLWPLFLAVIVQSLTLGLPIAAGIYCYKYLNEKKENPNENDEQNTATLKPRNQLPVKYAVMLKRPVAFKRVRMKRGQNR